VTNCPACGALICERFPVHHCKVPAPQYLVWKQYEGSEPYVYHVGLTLKEAQQQTRFAKQQARDQWESGFRAGYRQMTEADWQEAREQGTPDIGRLDVESVTQSGF